MRAVLGAATVACALVLGCLDAAGPGGGRHVSLNIVPVFEGTSPLATPTDFVASAQRASPAGTSGSFVTERPAPRAAMRGARPDALRLPAAASPMVSPPPRRYGPALPAAAPIARGATPERQVRIERIWQRRQGEQARRAEVEARQQAEREAQRGNAAPQSPRN